MALAIGLWAQAEEIGRRGGSWNNQQNNARCAFRNRNQPNNRNNNNGCRVAGVSHIF